MARYVDAKTEGFINFNDAGYYDTYGATTATQCNNKLIPYQIYGINGI